MSLFLYFSFKNFLFFFLIFVVQFNCPNDLARLQLDSSKNENQNNLSIRRSEINE